MQKRGCVSLKTKRRIPDALIALVLAAAIVLGGIGAINLTGRFLSDHRDTVVSLDIPEGVNTAPTYKDILSEYPWSELPEDALYTTSAPDIIQKAVVSLDEFFPGYGDPKLDDCRVYLGDGIYYVENIWLRDPKNGKEFIMNAAFEADGILVSFDIEPTVRGEYDTSSINSCYRSICDYAEYHRLNGSATNLTYILGCLESGVYNNYEGGEVEIYDDGSHVTMQSDEIYFVDPLTDFFTSYCIWSANMENTRTPYNAYNVISLMQTQYSMCYYHNGKIYLRYENTLGELTLCWDMETYKLAGMTYKKS